MKYIATISFSITLCLVVAESAPGDEGPLPRLTGVLAHAERIAEGKTWQIESTAPRFGAAEIAYSPDGRYLATGGRRVRIYDSATFRLRRLIEFPVHDLAWSPDGNWLAVCDYKKETRLFRFDGTPGRVFPGNASCLDFSPDGKLLAAGSFNRKIQLWNVDGTRGPELAGHRSWVFDVAWSPDGSILASAGSDKLVRLWRADGTLLRELDAGFTDYARCVEWSPDGKQLVAGSSHWVCFWRTNDWMHKRIEAGAVISFLAWSPDGELLAAGDSNKGETRLLKADGTHIDTLLGSGRRGDFSPDGRRLALGGQRRLELWSVKTRKQLHKLTPYQGGFSSLVWSPDGKQLLVDAHDRAYVLAADGKSNLTIVGEKSRFDSVAWGPDGKQFATTDDKAVRLWSLVGKCRTLLKQPGYQSRLVWSRSTGQLAVADGNRKSVQIWKTATEEPLQWKLPEKPRLLDARPDDRELAVTSSDRLYLLRSNGKTAHVFNGDDDASIGAISYSPDGRQFAFGYGSTIHVRRDMAEHALSGHKSTVEQLAFSHDGRYLASRGDPWYDHVYLWDMRAKNDMAPIQVEYSASHIAWSPDSELLAVARDSSKAPARIEINLVRPNGTLVGVLTGHDMACSFVAWHPGGRLASTGGFGEVVFWETDGKMLWQAMRLADGSLGVLAPSGRLLYGNAQQWSREFVHVVRKSRWRLDVVSPEQFGRLTVLP